MNGAFYDHGKTGIRGITPRSTAIDKGGHDVRQHYERICNRLGACNLAISPENARSSRLARLAWGAPNSRHADKGQLRFVKAVPSAGSYLFRERIYGSAVDNALLTVPPSRAHPEHLGFTRGLWLPASTS
jgi:hypothetical protein